MTLFSGIGITIAARDSALSKVQVEEVLLEIRQFFPQIEFISQYIQTKGDLDLKTSLRTIDKTDFFTKEVDELLLEGKCRAAVHSAKDLPHPLCQGLMLAAITKGVDSSDSLVLREGETLDHLPFGAVIATSSQRREECVKALRPDFNFIDLRGKIFERLLKLENGEADGVVIAESALIRLSLTHLNRIKLPGKTAPLQGKLAITVGQNDLEMIDLFSHIDIRNCLAQIEE